MESAQTITEEKDSVIVKYSKKVLLNNFFLFCIFVLGYELKDFHIRWATFQLKRSKSLILAPRGHGKSTILTIAYLIWRIVKNPDIRILIVSNGAGPAQKFLEAIKNHFEKNSTLIALFGNFIGKKWSTETITVKKRTKIGLKEPTVSTVGVYGTIVSGHFDLVMVDDLVDFENASKKESRQKMWSWYWTVLHPCVDGEIHFIGTRYDGDDFYGRATRKKLSILQTSKGTDTDDYDGFLANYWLKDKALKNKDGLIFNEDGKEFPVDYSHPENLIALWPDKTELDGSHKFTVDSLLEVRKSDSVIFEMQYQNSSDLAKERIFKRHYFGGRYRTLPNQIMSFGGSDLAISLKDSADYFVMVSLYIDDKKNIYIHNWWRDKISAPKQFDAFKAEHNQQKFVAIGVESVAYQEAMAQWCRENSDVPAKSVKVHKDKVIRAHSILGLFENGKIFFREGLDILDLVDEFCMFPDGVHDDIVDAVVMAINVALSTAKFGFMFA